MAKAILELEMPQSCRECPLYKITDICDILSAWNNHMPVLVPSEGKHPDCPLQELPIIKARDETEEELDWANIRELIRTCLDLDEWKYSWHMSSLDYTDPKIAVQIKNIIKRKIQRREKELKMLKSCLKIINDIKKGVNNNA